MGMISRMGWSKPSFTMTECAGGRATSQSSSKAIRKLRKSIRAGYKKEVKYYVWMDWEIDGEHRLFVGDSREGVLCLVLPGFIWTGRLWIERRAKALLFLSSCVMEIFRKSTNFYFFSYWNIKNSTLNICSGITGSFW